MKSFIACLLLAFFFTLASCIPLHTSPQQAQYPALTAALAKEVSCDECTLIVDVSRDMLFNNGSEELVIEFVVKFCIDFKIENASVCSGIVQMFKEEFFYVLSSEMSSSNICGWFFDICPFPNVTDYNVTFPTPKPPHIPPVPPSPSDPHFTILHISDVHYDAHYTEGMNSDCGEPLCCRPSNGYGKGNHTALKWGNYNCDLNPLMLDSLLNQFKTMPVKPDFVFWTGDNPPHDVWMQTREGQLNNSAFLTKALQQAFGNIPVFACIGNHEGVPVNSFPMPPFNSWLMDAVGDMWSVWLPQDAVTSFKYGGYYATQLTKGIQVISLNMNYCNAGNGWLLLNNSDPAGELEWLVNTLQKAEDVGEKVYIIGHIPPGNHNCLPTWSTQFHQIVDRYEDTILSQFYGHTHNDAFEVFFDRNNASHATSVAYITPSVTTFTNVNPSYRIYTADARSGYIVESSTYHVNITDANISDAPSWEWEYNATSTYNMTTLFPADWANLITRLDVDDDLFQLFMTLQNSQGPPNPCNEYCKRSQICQISCGDSKELQKCTTDAQVPWEMVVNNDKC